MAVLVDAMYVKTPVFVFLPVFDPGDVGRGCDAMIVAPLLIGVKVQKVQVAWGILLYVAIWQELGRLELSAHIRFHMAHEKIVVLVSISYHTLWY